MPPVPVHVFSSGAERHIGLSNGNAHENLGILGPQCSAPLVTPIALYIRPTAEDNRA